MSEGMQAMQRYAAGMQCRGGSEAVGGYACICTLLRRDCIPAYPHSLPHGQFQTHGAPQTFADAQAVLAELRTPLHEARTIGQLRDSTDIPSCRLHRALRSLRLTHGVRRATFRDRAGTAWMLPS